MIGNGSKMAAAAACGLAMAAGGSSATAADAPKAGAKPGTVHESLVLTWRVPEDVMAHTNGSDFMPRVPENVRKLEGGAAATLPTLVQLRDKTGKPVGIASEIGMPRPGVASLKRGEPFEISYSIVIPGRGMLYTWCLEQYDEGLHKLEEETTKLRAEGKVWTGKVAGRETIGPGPNRTCVINHGTGEFAGATGTFYKEHVITRVDGSREVNGMSGWTDFVMEIDRPATPPKP